MPTVLELYSDALSDVGAIQPAQTPSGTTVNFVHRKFNDMVRQWSENRLRLFYVPEVPYMLIAGTAIYQIGPGAAQFPTPAYTRPVFIQSAQVVIGTARRFPLNILTRPQWEVYPARNLQDPDGPLALFYDYNIPIGTINLAPIPQNAQQMYISQWNPLTEFYPGQESYLVENYYPSAYMQPLRLGLAIALAPSYRFPVTQELLGLFQSSVAIIENKNREKLTGAFGYTQTLDAPTKGDADMIMPPQQQ